MKRFLLPIFLKIAKSLGIDEIQQRLDENSTLLADVIPRVDEAHVLATDSFTVAQFSEQRAAAFTNDQISLLLNQLREVQKQIGKDQQQLVFHVDQRQIQIDQKIEEFVADAKETREDLNLQISQFRLDLNSLRRSINSFSSGGSISNNADSSAVSNDAVIDDVLYVALEDAFRGERDVVAERQNSYVSLLGDQINSMNPLVDLGCGRGEWLKVLKSLDIPAMGIDGNSVCIAECKESGLTVEKNDILSFLKESKDKSFGSVTLFQVLEHLPFNVLVNVLQEIQRVLVPGGTLIAEVPNAKNVRVGSGTFWIDPTHQRPLYPELLKFLATYVGFSSVDGKYSNRLGPNHNLDGLPDGAKSALESAMEALDGPGDFALIARA